MKKERDNLDVAVRSSATAEDLPDASFAGQQDTFLNVQGQRSVLGACKRCFASLFTNRAISYRHDKGFGQLDISLSIAVQKMVRSDSAYSGVMFSIDTETGFKDVVFITAAYGLGENVVQGTVNPDEYYVFKPTLKMGKRPIVGKVMGAKQLKMVFPGKENREIKKILLQMYINMGKTAAETYLGSKEKIFRESSIEGWEYLEKAVAKKKGVILATGHIGNWEFAGKYIAARFKLSVVAKKQRNRYFDIYTNRLRQQDKVGIIDKKNAFREIIKQLRENYIIAILIDQNAGKNGILTNFLPSASATAGVGLSRSGIIALKSFLSMTSLKSSMAFARCLVSGE
jgi:phosphoenolpyruvate synthase/pyruvate phosphate dikinase